MKKIAYILESPIGSWIRYEIEALRKIDISPLVCPVNVMAEGSLLHSFRTARSIYLFSIFKTIILSPLKTLKLFSEWKNEVGKRMLLRAIYLAYEFRKRRIGHVHAHFAAGAGSMAYLIKEISGIQYSITVHAYDIFKGIINQKALHQKLVEASKIRCISQYNKDFILQAFPDLGNEKLSVIHCGVDVERYSPSADKHLEFPRIVSVANLVEKKGLIYLLKACKILKERQMQFTCAIIGNGEKRQELQRFVETNGLKDIVSLPGMYPNEKVSEALKNSSVFVLPCIIANDGDRDGVPVTLMEAMASGIPVISTHVSGIPELIESGVNGALVAPKNERELADLVEETLLSKELSIKLSAKGREKVIEHFNVEKISLELRAFFESMMP
jgi:colanic acid/amylovoran biosynthesis glycosyltransferase